MRKREKNEIEVLLQTTFSRIAFMSLKNMDVCIYLVASGAVKSFV